MSHSVGKTIVCLRGDYQAIKVIKEREKLLLMQGIAIINDYNKNNHREFDVIISPLRDTPEYAVYHPLISSFKNVVYEEDPEKALNKAISYPNESFDKAIVGIDPGKLCGYVIFADDLIINVGKRGCDEIGEEIKSRISKIDHKRIEILLGSGEGWSEASISLLGSGLSYKIIREDEVARHMPKIPILNIFKDRDIRSAVAIALKGGKM
ncbi:MAG: hypothetical protein F7B61_03580 [Caldisphaeraceae archaeon]|nr:hypothetical protein [Caldisphaeraceae archaeon]